MCRESDERCIEVREEFQRILMRAMECVVQREEPNERNAERARDRE